MQEDSDKEGIAISEQGAAELVQLLLERGYFHKAEPAVKSAAHRNKSDPPPCRFHKDNAFLVETVTGSFITLDCLMSKFRDQLEQVGRWKVSEAATALKVSEKHIQRILPRVQEQDPSLLFVQDQEILTPKCLDGLASQSLSLVNESDGRVLLSDVAQVCRLPLDLTRDVLIDRLADNVHMRQLQNGSQVLVSQEYMDGYRNQVLEAFAALAEPTRIDAICSERDWEPSWVSEFLHEQAHQLPGRLSGDSYVPRVYTERTNQAVHNFYAANGFVTINECHAFGILVSQMKEYAREELASALILNDSVVDPDVIISPVVAVVLDTMKVGGWLDLSMHLPGQLLSLPEDVRTILDEHVLAKLDQEATGMTIFYPNGALFFSEAFIDGVKEMLLPKLVEAFAKARALELEAGEGVLQPSSPTIKDKKRKKKKTSSKANHQHSVDETSTAGNDGLVPVDEIVRAILDVEPNLTQIAIETPTSGQGLSEGPMGDLVRRAFYTDDFRSECERSVQAEVRRLQSAKASKASRTRKDAASKVQSVEGAFEDPSCFATACYMIQASAKFLQYAANSDLDEAIVDELQKDFLRGCCADFTNRVTQFCLFKNEVDEGIFSFEKENVEEDGALSYYCSPVEPAVRRFRDTFLSCTPDDEGKPRDPLPTLREILPGSLGVSLARQWVLCGGDCYKGGVKKNEDGSVFVRPGDVDGFLAHVEENCLTVCGLPFKKQDKKSEKQFLFSRRQRLTQLLEDCTDAGAVLELTIMLLFQLVKNTVVTGPLLRGSVLQLLIKERKISEDVANALTELADHLAAGGTVDEGLVERVKACGLHRETKR